MFDEIVGEKKKQFKILNVPVPNVEQVIENESVDDDWDDVLDANQWRDLSIDDGMEDL